MKEKTKTRMVRKKSLMMKMKSVGRKKNWDMMEKLMKRMRMRMKRRRKAGEEKREREPDYEGEDDE